MFKKGEHSHPANYRQVSLTNLPCKILEHIFVSYLMDHLERNHIYCAPNSMVSAGWDLARPSCWNSWRNYRRVRKKVYRQTSWSWTSLRPLTRLTTISCFINYITSLWSLRQYQQMDWGFSRGSDSETDCCRGWHKFRSAAGIGRGTITIPGLH